MLNVLLLFHANSEAAKIGRVNDDDRETVIVFQ